MVFHLMAGCFKGTELMSAGWLNLLEQRPTRTRTVRWLCKVMSSKHSLKTYPAANDGKISRKMAYRFIIVSRGSLFLLAPP